MRILALEPYYGGSHKAFLDGWSDASRHEWTILTLPPHKWKWRMRHAAVTFAGQVSEHLRQGEAWDVLFCSDMLNLAEFRGLVPHAVSTLPMILYFHENQLTYPVRVAEDRDLQFAVTNMTSALAAEAVWFNSAYHRDSFLEALDAFLKRMPDHQPTEAVTHIRRKAGVHPPGVRPLPGRRDRQPGPLRILWAARWEHDKSPEDFFAAIEILQSREVDFRISVIGEQFDERPDVFDRAREAFAEQTDAWGYQTSRADYVAVLQRADVFVSTASHEFFGLSAVEATLAGAYPLLPARLAYPEVFDRCGDDAAPFFYDGRPESLAHKLTDLAQSLARGESLLDRAQSIRERLRQFEWPALAPLLDAAAERVVTSAC
jgi:glycosyltransferase involved in cell wall biosynthesis